MYVIEYRDDNDNPKLTCDGDLARAKVACAKWRDEGVPSKIYLVRDTEDARAAIAAVELGAAEVIYEPTDPASEKDVLEGALEEFSKKWGI